MKLERVTLENFGVYQRQTFQLDAAPLVLLYGANESGKTTALNGIRQALFGFRPRTPYLTGATMSAEVDARLADGQLLSFTRRKGRPDDVQGTLDSNQLDAKEIEQLLGSLDLDSYEELFGFSQSELRQGQEALKSARLSEALAGGSLSGINALEKLRSELTESLAALYKSRGSTSTINVQLAEIKACQDQLRQIEILPSAVDDLRKQLGQTKSRSQELQLAIEAEIRRRGLAEKRLAALPKFRECKSLQIQLGELEIPDEIDVTLVAQWGDFTEQRKAIANQLDTHRSKLSEDQSQLEGLGGESHLLEFEAPIEALGHQAKEIPSIRKRVVELKRNREEAKLASLRLLESLQLTEFDPQIRDFSISVPERKQLDELSDEFVRLSQDVLSTSARLEAAKDSFRATESADAEEVPSNLVELQERVQQLGEQEQSIKRNVQLLEQHLAETDQAELATLLLEFSPSGTSLNADWSVPKKETLEQFAQQFEKQQADWGETQRQIKSLMDERAVQQEQLKQLGEGDAAHATEKLQSLGQQRDAILEHWLDELSQPLIAASISPEQQQERIHELMRIAAASDQTKDEILSIADRIAAENVVRSQLERLETQLQDAKLREEERERAEKELHQRWNKLWQPLPVTPATPREMLEWASNFESWRLTYTQQQRLRRELHQSRSAALSIRGKLLDSWPGILREDTSQAVLQTQIQSWQAQERQHSQDQERRIAASASVKRLADSLEQLQSRQRELGTQYANWLTKLPVTERWPIEQVTLLLDSLESLKREHSVIDRATEQIDESAATLDSFTEAVNELGKQLSTHSPTTVNVSAPEETATHWLNALHEIRNQRATRIQLTSSIKHLTQRTSELADRLSKIDSRLASLMTAAANFGSLDTASLLERVRTADKLRNEVSAAKASLQAHCGAEDVSQFFQSLEGIEEFELRKEVEDANRQLTLLENQRQETEQSIGSISQQIEQIAQSKSAQRQQQSLQNRRGQLAESSEQWVVERLALELLKQSIQRFAEENEPGLLRSSRTYLKALTGNRYVTVEHEKAQKGKFFVRNATGASIPPERLSTGTREQLYLAIRMAFITQHCFEHEPLPVVMDDCFVNFDDTRTRFAIEAISGWDDSIQTIMLSCHHRMVDLLADIAPQAPVIHLERNQVMTAVELNSFLEQSLNPGSP